MLRVGMLQNQTQKQNIGFGTTTKLQKVEKALEVAGTLVSHGGSREVYRQSVYLTGLGIIREKLQKGNLVGAYKDVLRMTQIGAKKISASIYDHMHGRSTDLGHEGGVIVSEAKYLLDSQVLPKYRSNIISRDAQNFSSFVAHLSKKKSLQRQVSAKVSSLV